MILLIIYSIFMLFHSFYFIYFFTLTYPSVHYKRREAAQERTQEKSGKKHLDEKVSESCKDKEEGEILQEPDKNLTQTSRVSWFQLITLGVRVLNT